MKKADIIKRSERDEDILVRKSPAAENARSASEDDGGRLLTAARNFSIQAGHSKTLFFLDLFSLLRNTDFFFAFFYHFLQFLKLIN